MFLSHTSPYSASSNSSQLLVKLSGHTLIGPLTSAVSLWMHLSLQISRVWFTLKLKFCDEKSIMKLWGYSVVRDVEIDHRVFVMTITLEPANDL